MQRRAREIFSIRIWASATGIALAVFVLAAASAQAFTQTAPFDVGSGTSTHFVVNGSGKVGIGTANPGIDLEIVGNSEPGIKIYNSGMSGNPALYISMNSGNNAALFQSTKDFKFYNGQYGLTILASNGNVGLGTVTPSSKLTVSTTANTDGITLDGTTNPAFVFKSNGTARSYFGLATAAGAHVTGAAANDIVLRTEGGNMLFTTNSGGGSLLTLKAGNGGVGVGTLNPVSKLGVLGSHSNPALNSSVGSLATFTSDTSVQLQFGAIQGNGYASWIQSKVDNQNLPYPISLQPAGGNVGIGTLTPQARLDVAGNINVGSAGAANAKGITLYDGVTGAAYCMKMLNGVLTCVSGACN